MLSVWLKHDVATPAFGQLAEVCTSESTSPFGRTHFKMRSATTSPVWPQATCPLSELSK